MIVKPKFPTWLHLFFASVFWLKYVNSYSSLLPWTEESLPQKKLGLCFPTEFTAKLLSKYSIFTVAVVAAKRKTLLAPAYISSTNHFSPTSRTVMGYLHYAEFSIKSLAWSSRYNWKAQQHLANFTLKNLTKPGLLTSRTPATSIRGMSSVLTQYVNFLVSSVSKAL